MALMRALLLIRYWIHTGPYILAICVVVHVTDGLQIEFDYATRAADRPLSTGGVAMQHIHIPKASGMTTVAPQAQENWNLELG